MSDQTHAPRNNTAAKILTAADQLFGERGYDGVSMRDIAQRADVNKASVFYYYNSKDELFELVLEHYYTAHQNALELAFGDESRPLRERFHHLIDAYLDFIENNQRYPKLVQSVLSSGQEHVSFIQQSLAPMVRWLEGCLEGMIPTSGPLAARHFYATIAGAVLYYFIYADALAPVWDDDPLAKDALAERRAHIHWMIDTFLDHLFAEANITE